MTVTTEDVAWADAWQDSWDRQQEGFMPERPARIDALVDLVEASSSISSPVGRPAPLVLDLACGTGSITRRLLERVPTARSIAVDIDPALLAIAQASLGSDDRVQLVTANLLDPDWPAALPATSFDAVVTATALHWLPEAALRRLYADLARLARPGGVVGNADAMANPELPQLGNALEAVEAGLRDRVRADGRPGWEEWWDLAAADPVLADAVEERRRFFGGNHPAEFDPPADWHVRALRDAGFSEAGVAYRWGNGALVAAVR
jgi:SAM-dependent methyltransferase